MTFVWLYLITFSTVHLFHVGLDIVNGISANMPPTTCSINLGDRKLIDLKFLDDKNLVILCTEPPSKSITVSSPLTAPSLNGGKPITQRKRTHSLTLATANAPTCIIVPFQTGNIEYSAYDPDQPRDVTVTNADEFKSHSLPEDKTMKPIRMEVHDSSGLRGHIPKRICLLAGNKTTLRTFELPK